jgi:hypothetical protein
MRMPTFGILAVLLAVLPTVDEAQEASSTATASPLSSDPPGPFRAT